MVLFEVLQAVEVARLPLPLLVWLDLGALLYPRIALWLFVDVVQVLLIPYRPPRSRQIQHIGGVGFLCSIRTEVFLPLYS